ncbi:hypothetical protein [Marinicellulosiphila megalodicopiae]|uniref:hypothetical protein n=1 Tax=Marinicellulosiphila megalodicopiae TaxID=2724896 RepID=UPI003BB044F6
MSDYSEVSLGFAEFVGQLLNETFEATLSAHQHQLDRYQDIRKALALPSVLFVEQFVDQSIIESKEIEITGDVLTRQMPIKDEYVDYILELTEDYEEQTVVYNGKLTNYGFDALTEVILEMVSDEAKSGLQLLLRQGEQARLVVDSGEITAKLELTNVYQKTEETNNNQIIEKTLKTEKLITPANLDGLSTINKNIKINNLIANTQILPIKEISLKDNTQTIFIDKEQVQQVGNSSGQLPVRISAKPATTSSTANILSQVTIRFKTV